LLGFSINGHGSKQDFEITRNTAKHAEINSAFNGGGGKNNLMLGIPVEVSNWEQGEDDSQELQRQRLQLK